VTKTSEQQAFADLEAEELNEMVGGRRNNSNEIEEQASFGGVYFGNVSDLIRQHDEELEKFLEKNKKFREINDKELEEFKQKFTPRPNSADKADNERPNTATSNNDISTPEVKAEQKPDPRWAREFLDQMPEVESQELFKESLEIQTKLNDLTRNLSKEMRNDKDNFQELKPNDKDDIEIGTWDEKKPLVLHRDKNGQITPPLNLEAGQGPLTLSFAHKRNNNNENMSEESAVYDLFFYDENGKLVDIITPPVAVKDFDDQPCISKVSNLPELRKQLRQNRESELEERVLSREKASTGAVLRERGGARNQAAKKKGIERNGARGAAGKIEEGLFATKSTEDFTPGGYGQGKGAIERGVVNQQGPSKIEGQFSATTSEELDKQKPSGTSDKRTTEVVYEEEKTDIIKPKGGEAWDIILKKSSRKKPESPSRQDGNWYPPLKAPLSKVEHYSGYTINVKNYPPTAEKEEQGSGLVQDNEDVVSPARGGASQDPSQIKSVISVTDSTEDLAKQNAAAIKTGSKDDGSGTKDPSKIRLKTRKKYSEAEDIAPGSGGEEVLKLERGGANQQAAKIEGGISVTDSTEDLTKQNAEPAKQKPLGSSANASQEVTAVITRNAYQAIVASIPQRPVVIIEDKTEDLVQDNEDVVSPARGGASQDPSQIKSVISLITSEEDLAKQNEAAIKIQAVTPKHDKENTAGSAQGKGNKKISQYADVIAVPADERVIVSNAPAVVAVPVGDSDLPPPSTKEGPKSWVSRKFSELLSSVMRRGGREKGADVAGEADNSYKKTPNILPIAEAQLVNSPPLAQVVVGGEHKGATTSVAEAINNTTASKVVAESEVSTTKILPTSRGGRFNKLLSDVIVESNIESKESTANLAAAPQAPVIDPNTAKTGTSPSGQRNDRSFNEESNITSSQPHTLFGKPNAGPPLDGKMNRGTPPIVVGGNRSAPKSPSATPFNATSEHSSEETVSNNLTDNPDSGNGLVARDKPFATSAKVDSVTTASEVIDKNPVATKIQAAYRGYRARKDLGLIHDPYSKFAVHPEPVSDNNVVTRNQVSGTSLKLDGVNEERSVERNNRGGDKKASTISPDDASNIIAAQTASENRLNERLKKKAANLIPSSPTTLDDSPSPQDPVIPDAKDIAKGQAELHKMRGELSERNADPKNRPSKSSQMITRAQNYDTVADLVPDTPLQNDSLPTTPKESTTKRPEVPPLDLSKLNKKKVKAPLVATTNTIKDNSGGDYGGGAAQRRSQLVTGSAKVRPFDDSDIGSPKRSSTANPPLSEIYPDSTGPGDQVKITRVGQSYTPTTNFFHRAGAQAGVGSKKIADSQLPKEGEQNPKGYNSNNRRSASQAVTFKPMSQKARDAAAQAKKSKTTSLSPINKGSAIRAALAEQELSSVNSEQYRKNANKANDAEAAKHLNEAVRIFNNGPSADDRTQGSAGNTPQTAFDARSLEIQKLLNVSRAELAATAKQTEEYREQIKNKDAMDRMLLISEQGHNAKPNNSTSPAPQLTREDIRKLEEKKIEQEERAAKKQKNDDEWNRLDSVIQHTPVDYGGAKVLSANHNRFKSGKDKTADPDYNPNISDSVSGSSDNERVVYASNTPTKFIQQRKTEEKNGAKSLLKAASPNLVEGGGADDATKYLVAGMQQENPRPPTTGNITSPPGSGTNRGAKGPNSAQVR
jgi:hypothetical protein